MRSYVIDSGGPYVFVVSIADSTDAGHTTLVLDSAFPAIQSLQPSLDGTLAVNGVQSGAVAFNPQGPAANVVFLNPLGVGGVVRTALTSAKLALNADGTPVLDGTTHTPTVTVVGTVTATDILWVALVPASY
jgi:hypothetical protein